VAGLSCYSVEKRRIFCPCQKSTPGRDSNLIGETLDALPVNWHVLVSGRKEKGKRKRKGQRTREIVGLHILCGT
jgi:hypothetical protein